MSIDSRWADNSRLDDISILCSGFENDLVDITVESLIGKIGEFADARVIVEFFLFPFS